MHVDAWRLIIDPPSPAGYNMAVDEVLVDSCRHGAGGPTLRLYGWDRPAVSLGYFQRPDRIVDLDRCREAGVAVVRRTTGGRAVYHRHEVTYSVTAPVPHPAFPPTIRGAYDVIARALEAALRHLGLPVERSARDPERVRHGAGSPLCFAATSRDEITLDGRKIVGSAQRRWPTAFLQHGSILLRDDPLEAPWFLDADNDPHEPWALRPGLTREHVCDALVASWRRSFGIALFPGPLSTDERTVVAQSSHQRDLAVTQPV